MSSFLEENSKASEVFTHSSEENNKTCEVFEETF
jgi:hypothetical protein